MVIKRLRIIVISLVVIAFIFLAAEKKRADIYNLWNSLTVKPVPAPEFNVNDITVPTYNTSGGTNYTGGGGGSGGMIIIRGGYINISSGGGVTASSAGWYQHEQIDAQSHQARSNCELISEPLIMGRTIMETYHWSC